MCACELQRALPRLGAGIRKEHSIHAGALRQPHCQFRLAFVVKEVRSVDQRATLIHDGSFDRRMPISERVDADTAEQVEVLRATFINQVHTLAADKQNRIPLVSLQQQLRLCRANLIQFRQCSHSSLQRS